MPGRKRRSALQGVKATRVAGVWAAAWLAMAILANSAAAEEFGIGSKAPPIDIEHWLQDRGGAFKPVTELPAG